MELAQWFNRWGAGVAICVLKVWKTSSLFKATQFSHCLSPYQKPPQKNEGLKSHCWVQPTALSAVPKYSRVTLPAVGNQAVHSPGWAVTIGMLVPGRWHLSFPGRLNPHWCSLPNTMQAPLSMSVALGWGSLRGVETPHSWGEGVLQPLHLGAGSSPFHISTFLTSLYVASTVNPWL